MFTPRICELCEEAEATIGHAIKGYHVNICPSCLTREKWKEQIVARVMGDVAPNGGFLVARVEGHHYTIADQILGSGGHKYVFRFINGPFKGQVITSTNVWSQGMIPEEYRLFLPDNAVIESQDPLPRPAHEERGWQPS